MRYLVFFLLFLIPTATLAQQDQSDRGYFQALLEDAFSAPGRKVEVTDFAGALSSRATIKTITVTDPDGVWLTASDVALVWSRSALLAGHIEIDEISVGRIVLQRPPLPPEQSIPSPEASGAFALPELLVSVSIDKMKIDRIDLGKAVLGVAARLSFSGEAELADGAGSVKLEIARIDREGQFAISGSFDNETRVLGLDLDLSEPADGIAANLLDLPGKPPVALKLQGKDPITDFRTTLSVATGGQERLSGNATLITDEDGATKFAVDVGGDISPVLAPEFHTFLGDDVRVVAQGERTADGGFDLSQFRLRSAAMQLAGAAEIGKDGWPQKLMVDGSVTPLVGERVLLPIPGRETSVQTVEISGFFESAVGENWKLDGRMHGLRQGDLVLDTAEFSGAGSIDRAARQVAGRVSVDARGLELGNLAMRRAVGDRLHGGLSFDWSGGSLLKLRKISLSGADYGLGGTVTVEPLNDIGRVSISPDVALKADNLGRFSDLVGVDLNGQAELGIAGRFEPLSGVLRFDLAGKTFELVTGIEQLDPLLSGHGALAVTVERDQRGLRVDRLNIRTDHASIDASANLRTGHSNFKLRADVPDLARAIPELAGATLLSVKGRQSGEIWDLSLDARLPGDSTAGYEGTITGDGRNRLTAQGALSAASGQLDAFSDLIGRPLSGAADIFLEGEADILARSFAVKARGQTQSLRIGEPGLDPLLRGTLVADFDMARSSQGTTRIKALKLDGQELTASISGHLGEQSGKLDYRLGVRNLAVVVPDLPGAANLSGTANLENGNWNVRAAGQGPGGISVAAEGPVAADFSTTNMALVGSLPLALANTRLKGQAITGVAKFDLKVNGPPALRSVDGSLSVDNARFAVPAQNLALNQMRGRVNMTGGAAQISLDADVSSGGRLRVEGPISLIAPYNADLVARFINVTLRDASLFEADLAGQVALQGAMSGGARISGALDLEKAELRIPQTGPSYSALDGLRHLHPTRGVLRTLRFAGMDQKPDETSTAPGYPIDLILRAPARVFVRGRGLDAELGGELRLTGSTNNIVPVGGFSLIRGRLDLLGRRLNLSEADVQMRGSFDPVISFAATSQVEDVAITLGLAGLASAPDLTVTSVPELPQEEALSYFLFGREVTNISAFQAVKLAAAIRTLSGRGGPGFTEQLRSKLGVDDLDIGADAEGNAQARVGKYISDNIYTDLTLNGDGTSQINLNLDVSNNVTVRSRLGNDGDTGIGLFFEKDY